MTSVENAALGRAIRERVFDRTRRQRKTSRDIRNKAHNGQCYSWFLECDQARIGSFLLARCLFNSILGAPFTCSTLGAIRIRGGVTIYDT